MRWLSLSRPACSSWCAYCGGSGMFRHVKSFEHNEETLSLHECPTCKSLTYDLNGIDIPMVSKEDLYSDEAGRAARYALETGVSSYYITKCALAALPDLPEASLRDLTFVDVGAGLGLASYLVKTIFGVKTVTVEPSFTGKISHDVLGLDVHRAYFEDLPDDLLKSLSGKPCCLHLNSVIEHLADPFAVLRQMMTRAKIEVLAIIVPDGTSIDFNGPFVNALPFLAPRDHHHLPSKLGIEMLLKRLGFANFRVDQSGGLLSAIGSRAAIALPSERTIKLTEQLLLENMMRHPNAQIAAGGASRLLPFAVLNGNAPLVAELRAKLPYEDEADDLLRKIERRDWNDLPFHLGSSCYWLAHAAMSMGRLDGALSLVKVVLSFADAIAKDYPHFAMSSIEFKWAAMLLEVHILSHQERFAKAEITLRDILASKSNPQAGARAPHIAQAENELKRVRTRAEEALRRDRARAEDNRQALEAIVVAQKKVEVASPKVVPAMEPAREKLAGGGSFWKR